MFVSSKVVVCAGSDDTNTLAKDDGVEEFYLTSRATSTNPVREREPPVNRLEVRDEPLLVFSRRFLPGHRMPRNQQGIRICKLPDQSSASMSDRFAGTKARELLETTVSNVRLTDVDHVRACDPVVRKLGC